LRKKLSVLKHGVLIYLSIDFEKGNAFEVCDSKGKHMGEFRFNGIENGKIGSTLDDSGEHDIWAITHK